MKGTQKNVATKYNTKTNEDKKNRLKITRTKSPFALSFLSSTAKRRGEKPKKNQIREKCVLFA